MFCKVETPSFYCTSYTRIYLAFFSVINRITSEITHPADFDDYCDSDFGYDLALRSTFYLTVAAILN